MNSHPKRQKAHSLIISGIQSSGQTQTLVRRCHKLSGQVTAPAFIS